MRIITLLKISFLFILSVIAACSPSNLFPADYSGDQIHFGQGGGFTGNVSYYVILENGRLFQKQQKDNSYTHVTTWKKNFTREIFTDYEELRLDTLTYSEPGNLYYFVEMHDDNNVHRIVWGKPGFIPSPKLVEFYNILFKSTTTKS